MYNSVKLVNCCSAAARYFAPVSPTPFAETINISRHTTCITRHVALYKTVACGSTAHAINSPPTFRCVKPVNALSGAEMHSAPASPMTFADKVGTHTGNPQLSDRSAHNRLEQAVAQANYKRLTAEIQVPPQSVLAQVRHQRRFHVPKVVPCANHRRAGRAQCQRIACAHNKTGTSVHPEHNLPNTS